MAVRLVFGIYHDLEGSIAGNIGGVQLVDKRIPGKQLIYIDPGGRQFIDQGGYSLDIRRCQILDGEIRFDDCPVTIRCHTGGNLSGCRRDLGGCERSICADIQAVILPIGRLYYQLSNRGLYGLKISDLELIDEIPVCHGIPGNQVLGRCGLDLGETNGGIGNLSIRDSRCAKGGIDRIDLACLD